MASPPRPRVLFVAPSAYPLGGVQVWLDYILPGLEEAGFDVTFGLVAGRHHAAARYRAAHPFARTIEIRNPTGSPEGRVRALAEALAAVDPALLVVVNIADAYLAAARQRAAGGTLRVAAALHGLEEDILLDLARYAETIDMVVATNRLAELAAADIAALRDRVAYAPYGVVLGPRPSLPAPATKFELVYSGRIASAQKRVEDVAAIVERLDAAGLDWSLRIAGDGPEASTLRERLARFSARVMFEGVLSADDLRARIYQPGRILLITSDWETGPIVAWEAMAAGIAVVSSAYVGARAEGALENGVNALLFPVGDIEAAVSAIRSLADAALRERVVRGGCDLVAARYTRAKSVSAWAAALAACLARPARPPRPTAALPPSGRLDRLLGPSLAESLRRRLGLVHEHATPGGEWPHSHSVAAMRAGFVEALGRREAALPARKLTGAPS